MNEEEALKREETGEKSPAVAETEGEVSREVQGAGEEGREVRNAGGADNGENKPDGRGKGAKAFFGAVWSWLKAVVPGVALCAIIAVPSWFLGKLVPVIGSAVFAIVIGMVIAFFRRPKWLERGIKFTSKKVLQASIVFLGFGMNFISVVQVGGNSLLIIVSTIATSLILAFVLGKLLRIPSAAATLVGVGSSICGGSAIAATAPVIRAKDSEVATSISVIFLFNVLAAFTFPAIGQAVGMSDTGFGMWAGTAINDTSSVVAAGQSWSSMTGSDAALQYATIVKLTRTLAIIPITLALAVWQMIKAKRAAAATAPAMTAQVSESGSAESAPAPAGSEDADDGKAFKFSFVKVFPWFVIFFLVAAVINTWLFPAMGLSEGVSDFLSSAGKFMITLAMAAIGLNTNIIKLIRTGVKPILLGFICWVAIAFVSIGVQSAMGMLF